MISSLKLIASTSLLGAISVAGCDARQDPTGTEASQSRLPSLEEADFGSGERGCVTFEIRVRGRDQIEANPVHHEQCGSLRPTLAGVPSFDNPSRTVRLPIALENTGPEDLGAPARLLGWPDSLEVVTAPGLAGNRHSEGYVRLAAPDSQAALADPILNGASLWRYDDQLAPAGQPQVLEPGGRTEVRWIELAVHPGVEAFRVTLHAVARRQTRSITEWVNPEGSTLVLPDFVSVGIRPQSFITPQKVTVSATSTEETQTDYTATAVMLLDAGPRSADELRINTGSVAPGADMDVHLSLSESFLSRVKPGYRITVFGQWMEDGGSETLDVLDVLPSEIDPMRREARFVLPASIFTPRRTAGGSYEAVVVLGTRPLPPAPGLARHASGIGALSAAMEADGECKAAKIGSPLGVLRVTGAFSPPRHKGTDYRAATGTPVFAAADGVVERIGWDSRPLPSPDPRSGKMVKGWGRYVRIRHLDGTSTLYAHLVENSTSALAERQPVSKGQPIGLANNSGGSSGPHLHLEYLNQAGERIDPHSCIAPDVATYRGYWTRTGTTYKFNPFEAVVTRMGSSISVKWVFLPDDGRYAPARVEGDKVVWEYTLKGSSVTHRLKVTFDSTGCVGLWHHDYDTNDFFQYTDQSTCRVHDPSKLQAMGTDPPLAPSDSVETTEPRP